MAGQLKVDSINADSNLSFRIANTAVAFIDSNGLRPTSGNVSLDSTGTTGIRLPSANTLAFFEGGAEAMRIDANGNIGIGTSSPNTKLEVVGAVRATNSGSSGYFYRGYRSGTTSAWYVYDSGSEVQMTVEQANPLLFGTSNTERMRIDSSGNVGIGTTTPSNFNAAADNLVVGTTSGNHGITIAGGTTGFSSLYMADGTTGNQTYRGYIEYRHADDAMAFGTAASERMRIDSVGNLRIGTTTTIYSTEKVSIDAGVSGGYGACISTSTTGGFAALLLRNNDGAAGSVQIYFLHQNTIVGSISTNAAQTFYNTTSDYRLKENIVPMTGALATVSLLKPVTYKWKADGSSGQGFIAHELAEVVPDAVTGEKDAVETYIDKDGNEQTRIKAQGIDTSFLVATLTAAIQELKAIVDIQAAEIAELKAK